MVSKYKVFKCFGVLRSAFLFNIRERNTLIIRGKPLLERLSDFVRGAHERGIIDSYITHASKAFHQFLKSAV